MEHLPFCETAVTRLPYYSHKFHNEILCKRDDLFSKAGGGSKARMLQYILADYALKKYKVIVTAGGPCSNFNRACALMCASLGIKMHLVAYTDEPSEFDTSLNFYVCQLADISITKCKKTAVPETIQCVLSEYQQKNIPAKFVYGGGKSLEGFYSYFEAVKNLFQENIEFDHVFLACGTGTTLTGICAAMQEFYPNTKVHAISVARDKESEMPVLEEDMAILNNYLSTNYNFKNLYLYDEFRCGGYSKYNDELLDKIRECISHEGMVIDPTYSGKAFWGMNCILESSTEFVDKKVLFWNTGGLFNLLSLKNG